MTYCKWLQKMVGMLLVILLMGCTAPTRTPLAAATSSPNPVKIPTKGSITSPDPIKVSSYEECLAVRGSHLLERSDPPQCITKWGQVFKEERRAADDEITPNAAIATGAGASSGSPSTQGPWLLYVHNSPSQGMYDVADVPPEIILLSQDGTGRTPVRLSGCFDRSIPSGTAAYLAKADLVLYLIQPGEATAKLVEEDGPYPTCETYFSGDEKGGLLATITEEAEPELIVFELPAGKIRNRFPLVNCSGDAQACNAARSLWNVIQFSKPTPQWSPNGRYLAFAALQDASSDLFVYDSQDGSLRRLTSGPDWVGPIEWSPDGSHIVMQEILNEDLLNYSSDIPSSVWSVSVNGNEVKQLYQTDAEYMPQVILHWLDDHRFIAYEGSRDPSQGSLNLRFVDMNTRKSRLLFDDWFGTATVDPVHETIAMVKQPTEKTPEGTYLISIENGSVRRLAPLWDIQDWDSQSGLFLSSIPCDQDPQGLQAHDYMGNLHCVPQPVPTPSPSTADRFPSPDGKQSLTVKDGLWLDSESGEGVQITQETVSDVTWCPDSTCFFFSIQQPDNTWTLYHVSLPDMTVKTMDEGIQSTGSYQWLGEGQ